VGTEDAAVGMHFVDDDMGEIGEQAAPEVVVGEQGEVHHFRVGDQDGREIFPDFPAPVGGGVAVIDRRRRESPLPEAAGQMGGKSLDGPQLILGERLEGKEVERPGRGVAQQGVEDRKIVYQRFAAGRRGRGHDIFAVQNQFDRLGLVGIEAVDSGPVEQLPQGGGQPGRRSRGLRSGRGLSSAAGDLGTEAFGSRQGRDIFGNRSAVGIHVAACGTLRFIIIGIYYILYLSLRRIEWEIFPNTWNRKAEQ